MSSQLALSEEQLQKIHYAFNQGDADADEKLSWKEFARMSKNLRLGLSDTQIRDIFKTADDDQSGFLTFAEFLTTYFSIADTSSRMKTAAIPSISSLDERKLGEVRAYFYDKKTNKGKVTRMECLSMLRDMGIGMRNDEITKLFKLADADNDNMISYGEFKLIAAGRESHSKNPIYQENFILKERFLQYDGDGDEKLTRLEFQELLDYLRIPIDKRSLATVFREVDTSRDGNISWEEFYEKYRKIQGLPGTPGWTQTAALDKLPSEPPSSQNSKRTSSSSSSSEGSDKFSRKDVIRTCNYFWSADKNGDGRLNREEFGNMVRSLKLKMSEDEIDKAFRKSDKDKEGSISFAEFAATFINRKSKHSFTKKEIKQTFDEMDKKNKGYLSVPDTLKALKMLGMNTDEAPLTSILCHIDDNHDGQISLEEFCVFLDVGV